MITLLYRYIQQKKNGNMTHSHTTHEHDILAKL